MQNHKAPLFIFLMAAILLSAGLALAQPPGMGNGMGKKEMRGKHEARRLEIQQQLQLSEAQQELLEEHRQNHRTQARELQQTLKTARRTLKEELQKPELDMTRVNQLSAQVKEGFGRLEDHRLAGVLEVRKILTPDQYVKFMRLTEQKPPWPGMPKRNMDDQDPPGMDD